MSAGTRTRGLVRVDVGRGRADHEDVLAAEEPLEIRVNGAALAVTMRTPGHDLDLVAGFLVSEGVIGDAAELRDVRHVVTEDDRRNVVDATVVGPGAIAVLGRERHVYTTSSCGVCGLASIDAVSTTSRFDVSGDATVVAEDVLASLPDRLRAEQELFDSTGGVHAAGLFAADGTTLAVREDVGRHNAVDKVVGDALRGGRLPLAGTVLQVSGRASFELVQKAAMAGIPALAAVSAPSSLAVDLAEQAGITLVGFSRGTRFNVYAHPERLV